MGACTFTAYAHGNDAEEAFSEARAEAAFEHGHGGYTGTVAEKDCFVMIEVPTGFSEHAEEYANHLMREDDPRISDKWGPAGCIKVGDAYLFFGWAST